MPAAAVGLALAAVTLWAIARWRRRHRADEQRVEAAAAAALKVPVTTIRLRRAKWAHGHLVQGLIQYARGTVLADVSADLAVTLEPFAAKPLTAQWQRRGDCFLLAPRPSRPARIEESNPSVRELFLTLEHLMPGVTVNQVHTQVDCLDKLVQFVAVYPRTTRDIGDGFRLRVQAVLDAKAPSPSGYWSLHWDPARSQVTIKPSIPLPVTAPYPVSGERTDELLSIPVGLGAGGVDQFWMPARHPHMLIVGPTGTGKTIFINDIIMGCISRGWKVDLADPKELSFRGFDPKALRRLGRPVWPGIGTVATTDRAMECLIDDVYQDVRRRYEALREFSVTEEQLQPRLLVIDEAGELVERLNAYQGSEAKLLDLVAEAVADGGDGDSIIKPKGTRNPELTKIWSILRLGRQCRVYVVVATQRPDVSFIPGEARANLASKVGLGKLDGYALEMVFGTRAIQQRVADVTIDPVTGQRIRQRISGRATVDLGGGPITIQGYWVPDPAKAITGELSEADEEIMRRLQTVTSARYTSAVRAFSSKPLPAASGPEPSVVLTKPSPVGERSGAVESDNADVADEPAAGGYVRADALDLEHLVLLEVDRTLTAVRITEIEPDPDSDDELQITYEIAEGDERTGQIGVTTLGTDELVAVPA